MLQLWSLRNLRRGSKDAQIGPLADNSRPTQNISNRTVRTNINFKKLGLPDDVSHKYWGGRTKILTNVQLK